MTDTTDAEAGPARLRLLGAVEMLQPRAARWTNERRFRLAAYLASRGDWVHRDQLATLFWPDRPQDVARSNLRKLLLEVRALALPQLESDRNSLRWTVSTDLADYKAALARGDSNAAMVLYGGPALRGLDGGDSEAFSAWLASERRQLHAAWRDAVLAAMRKREPSAVLQLARLLLEDDPSDEDAVVAALDAHRALEDRRGAAQTFRHYAERLVEALGVEPSARVRSAASLAGTALPPETQPAGAAASNTAAAPRQALNAESFIGRTGELQELSALLANRECRLLTVTGPGGMGKSRLVKEAVRQLASNYADGVIWIALDDLTDVAQVAPRMAAELSLALGPRQDPVERIATELATRHALLVLDNSEHLPALAALVDRLIAAAPRLQVLSTSRARIGSAHEWLLPLAGLTLPPLDGPAHDGATAAAVQMFVAHATAIQPRFDVGANTRHVAQLVRAVGGLPLAIMLAASWVRLLPMRELVSEVMQSFDVLERADEGEERPEHRSVRATFEQSWRLLAPAEQRALAALSVMAGPFRRAAAKEIAQAPLPLLAALVEKSLLSNDSVGRFTFHPLLLRFAGEKAERDTAALHTVQARHTAFFCNALAAIEEHLSTQANRAAADSVESDFENHRRAWLHACDRRDSAALTRGATGLAHFCELRGRWQDGVDLFRGAVDATAGDSPAMVRTRAVCLTSLAHLLSRRSEAAAAESAAREALRLARALRLPAEIRRNLLTITRCLLDRGETAAARVYVRHALAGARAAAQPTEIANAVSLLAVLEKQQGRYAQAAAGYQEALALRQQQGDAMGTADTLINLGSMHRAQKQTAEAIPLFEQVLRLADENALHSQRAFALTHLALGHFALKRFDLTRRYGELALTAARNSGQGLLEPSARAALARCATAEGDPQTAKHHLDQMLRIAMNKSLVPLQLAGLAILAELVGRSGHTLRAATLLAFVMTHPKATEGDQHGASDLLDELGIAEPDRAQGAAAAGALELDQLVHAALTEPAPGPAAP